jgi:hypothetical protein
MRTTVVFSVLAVAVSLVSGGAAPVPGRPLKDICPNL